MRGTPWSLAQARLVIACDLGALALLVVSATAAGGGSLQDQVVWLNAAVLATVLAVVANGTLFLVARRAVGRRRLQLLPDIVEHLDQHPALPPALGDWYCVPGTIRAHRAGCQMVLGKALRPVAAEVIRAERLRRCELCG